MMAKRSKYSLGALLFTGLGMWIVGIGTGARVVAKACLKQQPTTRNPPVEGPGRNDRP